MAHVQKKTVRTIKGIREHKHLGCPMTRNRTPWCFRICTPDPDGKGECGRVAPHTLMGATQLAIKKQSERQRQAHCEKLEILYLEYPDSALHEPGIRVSPGEADIVIPVPGEATHPMGIPRPEILKAMHDSAAYAVNSLVERRYVQAVTFSVSFTGATPKGELFARGRFVGKIGDSYLAETMLTDIDGNEIGRGEGSFDVTDIGLPTTGSPH